MIGWYCDKESPVKIDLIFAILKIIIEEYASMDSKVSVLGLNGTISVAEDPHYKLGMTLNAMCLTQGDILPGS